MSEIDTKFEICRDVEYVLKIGRDYQNKDGFRGTHYDTVKLLCDTIEYLRDQLPKPDPDWEEICEKCHDGEIEPKECEYYGEPDGCNSPIYGEHPKANPGNAAAMREVLVALQARFEKNTMAYQDRYFKFTGWHWRKKAEEAKKWRDIFSELNDQCKAGLTVPPRNCDIYNSESCRMAYHMHGDGIMTLQAFADWLFAAATERGEQD